MKNPKGFLWAGMQAGIKPNRKDLALVYSDAPCSAAGCFTQNLAKAAPVIDAEKRLPSDGIRAVVINSGNANALTGPEGLEDVRTVCDAVGKALQIPISAVVSASTGVIGHRLPAYKIVAAAPSLAASLKGDAMPAAEAIMTTDTRVKVASRMVQIDGKDVTLACICKGSGMIAPSLATMIAVVATDCAITPPMLGGALNKAMRRSFNALTVDGDMSTNDVVFALANGLAGNAPIADPGPALETFGAALDDICKQMAKEIAADGEARPSCSTSRSKVLRPRTSRSIWPRPAPGPAWSRPRFSGRIRTGGECCPRWARAPGPRGTRSIRRKRVYLFRKLPSMTARR